jgi:phosphoglycerate dehydrogenase-like enzyme
VATDPIVLLVTDTVDDRRGDEIRRIAPGAEVVRLEGTTHVGPDDLERLTVAFFSGDAFPERAPHFMQACLQSPGLQWLHSFSAGVDHPVFRGFVDRGVAVTTSSGASALPIAQTVMMYLLALTRDLPAWFRAQADHEWRPHRITELEGMRVGILGMGPIGSEVARLATAFGMHPIGVRRTVAGDEPCETVTLDRLHEVAARVDAMVLAVPLTDDTRGIVDHELLRAMRSGALLVNVARGEVVDEAALIESLRAGHLGGAALDVTAIEPLPADSPLWDLPNVIVTPHSSGASDRSDERAVEIFLDNLARWVAGTPLRNRA